MKIKIILAIILGLLGITSIFKNIEAQNSSSEWTSPEQLFLVTDGLRTNYLSVITDQADIVYSWWSTFRADPNDLSVSEPKSRIFHSQNITGDWRSPNDVMIWPDAGRMISVLIDIEGMLHAFSATDCLNYTTAVHDQALSARGWTNIGCLDEVGLAFPSAVQTLDGAFYVLYSSADNQSYSLIQSNDGGSTWSAYKTVLEIQDNFLLGPMLAVDQKDRLHLVWSIGQAPDAYPPIGVYYSRSDDGGKSWIPPVQLGGRDEGEPAIVVNNDEVHVLWNGDVNKSGRYYRYSPDAGETWSAIEVLSPPSSQGGNGGLQRPPAIILDNVGNVHVLLHEEEALYFRTKTNTGWTAKQALYNPEVMKGVEIFGVRLAITGGNTIHAFYILETYDFSKDEDRNNHIWRVFHQTREIDADVAAPIPWPVQTNGEVSVVSQTDENPQINQSISQNVLEFSDPGIGDQADLRQNNPSTPFFWGSLSVVLFLGFVILIFSISRIRFNRR